MTENFSHDVKLVLDLECQQIAEKVILDEFPDHGILGEEQTAPAAPDICEWIIDPIDGTLNYSHGFPYWCCSVAVRLNGRMLAGCVHAPEFNEYYTAHIEAPAKLNDEPIRVSSVRRLSDVLVFTGLAKDFDNQHEHHFQQMQQLALNTQKMRINGAGALDLCHVASGTGDAFFECGIHLWDFAAAALIAEQAGGCLSVYPNPNDTYNVLCTNPELIDELRAIHSECL